MYTAIVYCSINTDGTYAYEVSAKKFAMMLNLSATGMYPEAQKMADELSRTYLETNGAWYKIFSVSVYQNCIFYLQFSDEIEEFFTELQEFYREPLIGELIQLRTTHFMDLWTMIHQKIFDGSFDKKNVIKFSLFYDDIIYVFGKETYASNLHERIQKAIRSINKVCDIDIKYQSNGSNKNIPVGEFRFRIKCESKASDTQLLKNGEIKEKIRQVVENDTICKAFAKQMVDAILADENLLEKVGSTILESFINQDVNTFLKAIRSCGTDNQ